MKKATFQAYLREANFRELFITEMGWNNYGGQTALPPIAVEDTEYQFTTIAERNGFQILVCEADAIPSASLCRHIDTKLRRSANDYIAIYVLRNTEHHLWVAPVRQVEKRNIVTIEYETAAQADFLFSKIADLSFDLDERTTIVDVKQRIQSTFAVNSEKITKDFYTGFKKEHDAFVKFITGIDDEITDLKANRNKQWYTSVMLNRLMFCYFIQKKGFLDGNVNYLRDKLTWCQEKRGENQFFKSFYKGFLVQLFQDGLNAPRHEREFEQVYGKIPYLNGGMFDRHQIECDYQDIDIDDVAFERLFDFFDKWRWHLDTRISASGKDINPDVLGYIFEQYINDRAQMGAYYTKEDITEYIGRNCILPFLMDKVAANTPKAFSPKGEVWTMLQQSGDRYLFDAVKQGYTSDWRKHIPENIAIGLDTTKPNLLDRRKDWNTRTPEPFALPTEIWRETIERLQRCEDIIGKISRGEIHEVNNFITYNLDIRRFVQDLLEQTEDHLLVAHFYHALQQVTILDPTCGSGAFLFAALNILEPLYETCISRMEDFHQQNDRLFKDELAEISQKYRSNIQYFIYKSIILRNLYGVDIMAEAVEIAKLRLFLKMVAVVEADRRAPNLGLDPLPDIDFNIRCGNTLVGYATEQEIVNEATYGDMFTKQEFQEKVETEMMIVAKAFDEFRHIQLSQHEDIDTFKQAKEELKQRLSAFTDLLNHQMFSHTGGSDYDAWLDSHQPFHWIAEYYQIIHGNGGFDVVIGNPPYVQIREVDYSLPNYETLDCGDLYALCVERSVKSLRHPVGKLGMIIPISIVSTDGYFSLRKVVLNNLSGIITSNYGVRPAKLFDGVDKRLTILLSSDKDNFNTHYIRWISSERENIFQLLKYVKVNHDVLGISGFPKISYRTEESILQKLSNFSAVAADTVRLSEYVLLYTRKLQYFIQFFTTPPKITDAKGNTVLPSELKKLYFDKSSTLDKAILALNSNLFFWFFIAFSDCRNVNSREILHFPASLRDIKDTEDFNDKAKTLLRSFIDNAVMLQRNDKRAGVLKIQSYQPRLSKSLIDEIDKVLAQHYGFTEEELDFIINYDIKYRMGDELNED